MEFFYLIMNIRNLALLAVFLCYEVASISSVNVYADATTIGATNIYASIITDNGNLLYVSILNNSSKIIKKYNLTSGSLVYISSYVDPYNSLAADRLFIFNDTYLIAHSTSNLKYNIFQIQNNSYLGNSSINQYVYEFY